MFRKLILGTGILTAVLIIAGTSIGALGIKKMKTCFKQRISPETRVEMIRDEISDLDQEMKEHVSAVAEETVAVERLRDEIAKGEDNHKKQAELIKIMRKDIAACDEAGERFVSYGNQKYALERVRNKLTHDWDAWKKADEILKSQKDVLQAREVSLTAVRERLNEMRGKKEELQVQLAQVEADLKNVRLAQSRSDFHFDDSKFGEIQKEIAELRDWNKARHHELEIEGKLSDDPIPVGKKNSEAIPVGKKAPGQNELFKEIDEVLEQSAHPAVKPAVDEKSDSKLSVEK